VEDRAPKPFDQAYTTPLVISVGGRDQVVSVGAFRGGLQSRDRQGNLVRALRGWILERPTAGVRARPRVHHDRIFRARGPGGPGRWNGRRHVDAHGLVDLARRPFTPSPILVGDELYIISDLGVLSCADAKTASCSGSNGCGAIIRRHRFSPTAVFYFLSEEGVATVIAPGKTFRSSPSTSSTAPRSPRWPSRDGSFFIRSLTHLYRITADKTGYCAPLQGRSRMRH
jgi:hypothetical protein